MKLHEMHRKASNKAIKWGYRVTGAGRTMKRAGIGVALLGAASAGATRAAHFFGTGGYPQGTSIINPQGALVISPELWRSPGPAAHVNKILDVTGISQIPAVRMARELGQQHLMPRLRSAAAKFAYEGVSNFAPHSQRAERALSFAKAAYKAGVLKHSTRAVIAGAGLVGAGIATRKIGSMILRHGYASHPSTIKKNVRKKARQFVGAGVI